jgi:trehalose 6-phosphate synthase/phosphatase
MQAYDVKILDGNKVIEIMENTMGKGKAVEMIIAQTKYDHIICMGDDKTDEEMFEVLYNIPYADSVKIGPGSTCAKYHLKDSAEALIFLKQLID